jgi:hypothetical protein
MPSSSAVVQDPTETSPTGFAVTSVVRLPPSVRPGGVLLEKMICADVLAPPKSYSSHRRPSSHQPQHDGQITVTIPFWVPLAFQKLNAASKVLLLLPSPRPMGLSEAPAHHPSSWFVSLPPNNPHHHHHLRHDCSTECEPRPHLTIAALCL